MLKCLIIAISCLTLRSRAIADLPATRVNAPFNLLLERSERTESDEPEEEGLFLFPLPLRGDQKNVHAHYLTHLARKGQRSPIFGGAVADRSAWHRLFCSWRAKKKFLDYLRFLLKNSYDKYGSRNPTSDVNAK